MDESLQSLIHDLSQPLNIIHIVCCNLRAKLMEELNDENAAYLAEKLSRIDRQINRANTAIESFAIFHRKGDNIFRDGLPSFGGDDQ